MILRIFLDEFCKLRRERCGHRDRRDLAKIAKKILKSRVYKFISHKFKQFLRVRLFQLHNGNTGTSKPYVLIVVRGYGWE